MTTLWDVRSPGAVLDRISILQLKLERHRGIDGRRISHAELDALGSAWLEEGLADPLSHVGYRGLYDVNSALWRMENEVRERERAQRFGAEFLRAIGEIQRINAVRAQQRSSVNRTVFDGSGVDSLVIQSGLDHIVDRIAIAQVAADHGVRGASDAAQLRLDAWQEQSLPDIFSDATYVHLQLANHRLWEIKDQIDGGAEDREDELVCRSLYLVNDARCRAKETIARQCCSLFWDVKEYSTYDAPTAWDPAALRWATA